MKFLTEKRSENILTNDAAESWVQRWRQSRKIFSEELNGESLDYPNFHNWLLNTKAELLTQYSSKDIFSVDETALFHRMQVGRSFIGPNEKPE